MIFDKNKVFKYKSFSKYFISLWSYENMGMGVKGVLKHNKRQDISKITGNNYHLQKKMYVIKGSTHTPGTLRAIPY